MSNPVQTFVHERFGKIRVVMIDGEPYFVAADVCKALELRDVSKAVKRLNKNEKSFATIPARGTNSIPTQGGEQQMLIVNEPGLYRLIFASRKPEARDFQDWVYHEVLPSIRKTGSYSLFDKPAAEPVAEKTASAAIRPEAIYLVYVLLLSNGKVKIGITKRLCARISEIKRETGLTIADIYFTPLMSFDDARKVEKCCKEIFFTRRVKGEIFSVDFERACAAVERFVELATAEPRVSKLNIATVNLSSAEKSE